MWDKAAEHLIKAGDAAARTYAHAEARLLYAQALKALARAPDDEAHRRLRADTIVKQVEVSLRADGPDRNLARLQEAQSLVQTLPDDDQTPNRLRMARIHYWMGHVHIHRHQSREAVQYLRQVLAVAQEFQDEDLLAIPSGVIGQAMAAQGH